MSSPKLFLKTSLSSKISSDDDCSRKENDTPSITPANLSVMRLTFRNFTSACQNKTDMQETFLLLENEKATSDLSYRFPFRLLYK